MKYKDHERNNGITFMRSAAKWMRKEKYSLKKPFLVSPLSAGPKGRSKFQSNNKGSSGRK